MSPAGFEPAIPASERPQTHALDRATTGTGLNSQFIFTSKTRCVMWTKHAEEGQRTQEVNSLINIRYNILRIKKKGGEYKDRKLRKIFDSKVFEGCSAEVGHPPPLKER